MNKAPVQGYEKDVGSRATHRIMYPESATHLDNNICTFVQYICIVITCVPWESNPQPLRC